jgi:ATP-dependent RNA helicase DDX24/MAK5
MLTRVVQLRLKPQRDEQEDVEPEEPERYQWKKVKVDEAPVDLTDGFFGMEELEGEEAQDLLQQLLKHPVDQGVKLPGEDDGGEGEDEDEEDDEERGEEHDQVRAAVVEDEDDAVAEPEDVFVPPAEMAEWLPFGLHHSLLRGLHELKFFSPSPVQRAALHSAMVCGNDVVGAAQTGSGKTLAYGLPVLQAVIDSRANPRQRKGPMALILCPTRELALQVTEHLRGAAKYCWEGKGTSRQTLMIVPVVGGMSEQKQMRLLNRRPAVIVATPGRMWEFISKRNGQSVGETFLNHVDDIRFLVVDEADRLTQTGRYTEVQQLLNVLPAYKEVKKDLKGGKPVVLDEVDDAFWRENVKIPEEEYEEADSKRKVTDKKRTTFLFSATLGISLDAKRDLRKWKKSMRKKQLDGLERVLSLLDFHRHVEVFDLTAEQQQQLGQEEAVRKTIAVAEGVHQTFLLVTVEEKDLYLYSFLRKYGAGRAIVFCNAITGVKRLAALLRICGMDVHPLHASMQQRQRLKNLDRFKQRPNAILIATDVAARGLDIPNVAHVIHFDVPRNAELYIHRAGRTARAGTQGVSLVFVSPNDAAAFDLLKAQSRTGMRKFPLDVGFLPLAKDIMRKAKEIDEVTHGQRKINFEKNWKQKGQGDLGAEDDEDEDGEDEDRGGGGGEVLLSKEQKYRLRVLNDELKKMLAQPFLPRGMSTRYPTKSGEVLKLLSETPDALRDLRERTGKRDKPAPKEPAQKKRKKKAFFYKPK